MDRVWQTKCAWQGVTENCDGQSVMNKVWWTKCDGKSVIDKVWWTKCYGQSVLDNVWQTKCDGKSVAYKCDI